MNQLINEVFVFYLDRLLQLNFVLPTVITDFSGSRWKTVRDREVIKEWWKRGDPLVCSQYIEGLVPAKWPAHFTKQHSQISVPSGAKWSNEQKRDTELWGEVIAFDFLTGVADRLVNALGANKEGWRKKARRSKQEISLSGCRDKECKIENAFRDDKGKLVLVDNNSGFFYDKTHSLEPSEWMLSDICVFPKDFLHQLKKRNANQIREDLYGLVHVFEDEAPILNWSRTQVFMSNYNKLVKHLLECESQHKKISFFA